MYTSEFIFTGEAAELDALTQAFERHGVRVERAELAHVGRSGPIVEAAEAVFLSIVANGGYDAIKLVVREFRQWAKSSKLTDRRSGEG